MIIIQVALGVVLGFLILAFLREIVALGLLFAVLALALIVVVLFGISLYVAYRSTAAAAAASPLMQAVNQVFAFLGALIGNLCLVFAAGSVVESNSSLRGGEAYTFGFAFFAMALGSAVVAPWTVVQYVEGDRYGPWYIAAVVGAWASIIVVFWLRNAASKRNLQRGAAPNVA